MLSLKETLGYSNDLIVNKFRTMFNVSHAEATEIAIETYKWLWVNAQLKIDRKEGRQDLPRTLVIHVSTVIIDEFWHNFIFHTRAYEAFCNRYFGFFIHHTPAEPNYQVPTKEETIRQLRYISAALGEETIIKWYEEYPVKYSVAVLEKLQKPRRFGQPCEVFTS